MSKIQSKINMPVAQTKSSKMNLDSIHITSADFMELAVSYAIECPKGLAFNMKQECFSRLAPMPVPTFGRGEIRHKAFFVPFRTVWPAWNDFYNSVPHVYNNGSSSIPTNVPLIDLNDIYRIFTTSLAEVINDDAPEVYDFYYGDPESGPTERYYNFTDLGRKVYKLLLSLGYKFTFRYNGPAEFVSALPLMCFMRIYCDWFFSSQYANDPTFNTMAKYFNRNDEASSAVSYINYNDLNTIFTNLANVNYDSDYFTNVWDNPTGPNDGLYNLAIVPDVTTKIDEDTFTNNVMSSPYEYGGTPVVLPGEDGLFTQYSLNALRALTDYMKRNQIAGSRAVDRYLARFGVNLSNEKLNRSVLVGSYNQNLQFGDVTATADTERGNLGDYAGKGLTYGDGTYDFYTDELGYYIVVSSIVPYAGYYQGYDRCTRHITLFDFYQPEFDALGVQAISKGEVYTPIDIKTTGALLPVDYRDQVFGFVPRYAEYKIPRDMITGDIILRSRNAGKDAWHLFRDVEPQILSTGAENFVHSPSFVSGADAKQYNRIFYNTGEYANADHFNIIHNFKVDVTFPGASLYDDYEFKDEDKAKKVTINIGGSSLN